MTLLPSAKVLMLERRSRAGLSLSQVGVRVAQVFTVSPVLGFAEAERCQADHASHPERSHIPLDVREDSRSHIMECDAFLYPLASREVAASRHYWLDDDRSFRGLATNARMLQCAAACNR